MNFFTDIAVWQNAGIVAAALLALLALGQFMVRQVLNGLSAKLDALPAEEFRRSMNDIAKRFDSIDARLDYHLPNRDTPRLFMQVAEIKSDIARNKEQISRIEGHQTQRKIDYVDYKRCS